MPSERGRTKKLILALHYYLGGTAGWRCEDCRIQRLEESRRCGWQVREGTAAKVIWARGGSVAYRCPKSEITADSVAWLEMWAVWKHVGHVAMQGVSAKDLEAVAALEQEWERMRDEAGRPGA